MTSHICLNRSDQELREIEEAAVAAQTKELGRQRVQETWWCSSTEVESVCCHKWAIGMPSLQVHDAAGERTEHRCVTQYEGFLPLLSQSVGYSK